MTQHFDWFYGETPRDGRRLAFDIETNGLLPDVSTIHSLVIKDIDTGEVWSCASAGSYRGIEEGLDLLSSASIVFGHNIIGYDIPVIQHLHPDFSLSGIARDTLILAKMIWPMDALKQLDFPRWRRGILPGQLIGAHKLEAWGYRLGLQKGEYSAKVKALSKEYAQQGDLEKIPEEYHPLATTSPKDGSPMLFEWLEWCRPMQDYCEVDVDVTCKLLELITGHLEGTTKASRGIGWSPSSVKLEHDVWEMCLDQERRGYGYDLEKAVGLTGELKTRQRELERHLKKVFGTWWQPLSDPKEGERPARGYQEKQTQYRDVTIKRFSEKTGKELKPYVGPPLATYDPDAPFVKVRLTTFNAKSRQHLGDRLQAVFGWQPLEFGGAKGDQAKVDETTIRAIPEDVLPSDLREVILEYLVISKTLGQMADGKKSWNDLCAEDGRLHGRVDPLGTVSHRGAHKNPNLGQVPSVHVKETKDAAGIVSKEIIKGWKGGFGSECRSLFGPGREGWTQTGTDASGLELRLLGHYLWPYDGGEFARRVSTPGLDIHAENGKITGLSRAETKTATYAFLYGAGGLKLGMAVGVDDAEIPGLASSGSAKSYVRFMKRTFKDFVEPDETTLAHIMRGNEVKKKFLEGITGLKDLQKAVVGEGKINGFIVALDGRKLAIRKAHASLNQLLQGGGSIVCKLWMILMDQTLREDYGLVRDVDYGQMAWVHDELQFEHRPGLEGIIAEASSKAMNRTAEFYEFQGGLATDSKSGSNWMDCH